MFRMLIYYVCLFMFHILKIVLRHLIENNKNMITTYYMEQHISIYIYNIYKNNTNQYRQILKHTTNTDMYKNTLYILKTR